MTIRWKVGRKQDGGERHFAFASWMLDECYEWRNVPLPEWPQDVREAWNVARAQYISEPRPPSLRERARLLVDLERKS
jgi:hypothetical protein